VSKPHPHAACRNCGREIADGRPDPGGWCAECRAAVVRRSTPIAFGVALAVALVYLLLLTWAGGLESTGFLIFWLALGAFAVFGAFKVSRRVAFDLIRSRMGREPRR